MKGSDNSKGNRKNICVICGKEFYSAGKNKYCSPECKAKGMSKNVHTIKCKNCGKVVTVHKNAKFCSDACRIQYKNKQATLRKQEKRNKELTGIENIDYVVCKICGCKAHQLGEQHFISFHNISLSEYKRLYPDAIITSQRFICDNLIGDKNPSSIKKTTKQEREERSPFSSEFYKKRNLCEQDRIDFIQSLADKKEYSNRLEYYIKRGYSPDDAKKMLSERQRTFTLNKCIEKYGEIDGTAIYNDRNKKWSEKMERMYRNGAFSRFSRKLASNSYSTFELTCICDIVKQLGLNSNEYYSATSDLGQYCLFVKETGRRFYYDFKYKNKVIEFNGDYWHCNPKQYGSDYYNTQLDMIASEKWEADNIKKQKIIKEGCDVLTIWESDFRDSPEDTVKKCIDFINE